MFRRYVLLVTNGRPDCGANQSSACMDAQNAVTLLSNNHVSTVVVAPGQLGPDDTECLQGIAIYGGAQRAPYFHPAANTNELSDEVGSIMRGMAMDACELNLKNVRIMDPDRVALRWDGMQIPRDRDKGWELIGNGFEILLHDEWCDRMIDEGPAKF